MDQQAFTFSLVYRRVRLSLLFALGTLGRKHMIDKGDRKNVLWEFRDEKVNYRLEEGIYGKDDIAVES